MGWWDAIKRTGQRAANPYLVRELPDESSRPLKADSDYLRVWLCEMFLAQRSTLLAHWLPAASVSVSLTVAGRPTLQVTRMLRPKLTPSDGGVALLNYPVTDLLPYPGGVLEIDAALFGLQSGTRLDVVVDVLQAVSHLPIPAVDQAVTVAQQVATGARDLVAGTDGQVHLDVHQGWSSAPERDPGQASNSSGLRGTYLAALLATDEQVDPGTLRVVDNRLHTLNGGGTTSHLVGWDFLLLRVESRSERDDFWLPELEEQFGRAVDALEQGMPELAQNYRSAAVAIAWKSPNFTWSDRDRIITAVHARFDALANRGRGAAAAPAPQDLSELVEMYGDSADAIRAHGPLTEEQAFAGRG
ncbi:hypothetical protein SAMN04515665_103148 [Blastococcus sp. DSM 46786]|uniref:hypothetical protein n=1 Tax=Blastococcus sp. DSM 46786 TaxID=1798227 RepID=UPI0008B68CE3|nr:hypothetical protein [Blastococcus sp. DSM 46786]SEK60144.1 hypothetical protein SAMN04515665_103148 [Blastococcus sp. DSM 46786]